MPWVEYGGTSASTTSSNYTYSTGYSSGGYVSSYKSATILETRPPANTWDDVIKVKFEGQIYRLKDLVRVNGSGVYRISRFRDSTARVRSVGGIDRFDVEYEKLTLMGEAKKELRKIRMNPNEAFRAKKRGLF